MAYVVVATSHLKQTRAAVVGMALWHRGWGRERGEREEEARATRLPWDGGRSSPPAPRCGFVRVLFLSPLPSLAILIVAVRVPPAANRRPPRPRPPHAVGTRPRDTLYEAAGGGGAAPRPPSAGPPCGASEKHPLPPRWQRRCRVKAAAAASKRPAGGQQGLSSVPRPTDFPLQSQPRAHASARQTSAGGCGGRTARAGPRRPPH